MGALRGPRGPSGVLGDPMGALQETKPIYTHLSGVKLPIHRTAAVMLLTTTILMMVMMKLMTIMKLMMISDIDDDDIDD